MSGTKISSSEVTKVIVNCGRLAGSFSRLSKRVAVRWVVSSPSSAQPKLVAGAASASRSVHPHLAWYVAKWEGMGALD